MAEANLFLAAWVEERYHMRRHGTLKMTPVKAMEDALKSGSVFSKDIEAGTVRETFLWRENRQVTTLASISINGNRYEVDESLIGKRVEVRYNPYNLNHMLVFFEGLFRGQAKPFQMKNFAEKRVQDRQENAHQALDAAMEAVIAEHAENIKKKSGISFARAMEADEKDE